MKAGTWLCLATTLVASGCSNLMHDANTSVSHALAQQGNYELLGAKQYGDDVVCGYYRVIGSWGEPGQVSRFIYADGKTNLLTSRNDDAIFCSDSPVEALDQRFGIRLNASNQARYQQLMSDLNQLSEQLEQYYNDQYRYPSDAQGLEALVSAPTVAPKARKYPAGGYLDALPLDPWGQPYQYRAPEFAGAKTPFTLWSEGADQAPGGKGEDTDIYFTMLPYLEYAEARADF